MFRLGTSGVTISDVDQLEAVADATVTFEMDEDAFRAFYDRTVRALWNYLSRMTGDGQAADDLLQESYYRFLRSRGAWESEAHRRAYLFRIATNLVRDGQRRGRRAQLVALRDEDHEMLGATGADHAETAVRRTDLRRAMSRLRPRERALLWLAYGQGHAHTEIAETLGVKTASVKLLLFRARRKLAALLRRTRGEDGGPRANR
ncbi:MAG TPA: RNA polymerase sigma factor [Vicinamibacterales bacterium]|nr:RNA polymerase sigma factor [Vicinamibacterales bacterium]